MKRAAILVGALLIESCTQPVTKEASTSKAISCGELETCKTAVRELSNAEFEVQHEYLGALERLRTCKPEKSTRCYDMPHAIALIEVEQSAWATWRDAHCNVFTFSMENTSAEGEVRAFCRTKATRERAAELKQIRTN